MREPGVRGSQPKSRRAFSPATDRDSGRELVPQRRLLRLIRVGAREPQGTPDVLAVHDGFNQSRRQRHRRGVRGIADPTKLGQGRCRRGCPFASDAVVVVSVEITPGSRQTTQKAQSGRLRGVHEVREDVVDIPARTQRGQCPLLWGERFEIDQERTAFAAHCLPHRGRGSGRHGPIQPPARTDEHPSSRCTSSRSSPPQRRPGVMSRWMPPDPPPAGGA